MKVDAILVFNFGGQYCHLIGRRVRDNGIYSEIVQSDISLEEVIELGKKYNIKGIILSGGPLSIYEKGAPTMDKRIIHSGVPILGICYGHQILASYLDGKVVKSEKKEYGPSYVHIDKAVGVLKGLAEKEEVWMSHGDIVLSVPKEIETLATTDNCPVAAFMHTAQPLYGVQWHPEVIHTKNGEKLLKNFIFGVCKAESTWDAEESVTRYIEETRRIIGDDNAIIGLSGGVDSSTAAAIAAKAIGDRLTAVFVDTGLMRKREPEKIKRMAEKLRVKFVSVDASETFLRELKGVTDPEEKRKIIGRVFIRVFEEASKGIDAKYLIQGTIYPDRIESGESKGASLIKSHHNVGGLPKDVKFKGIVEPLKDLYKDEVRKLALRFGMPEDMVYRQPFPGPGLAVRIIGEVDKEKLEILRKAESIVSEEIEKDAKLRDSLWQYFAVLTGIKSIGVKGDGRAYGYVIAIRAVESKDAMTANFTRMPYGVLETMSTRLTSEIPEVVRVVYDITDKPPSTIEWE